MRYTAVTGALLSFEFMRTSAGVNYADFPARQPGDSGFRSAGTSAFAPRKRSRFAPKQVIHADIMPTVPERRYSGCAKRLPRYASRPGAPQKHTGNKTAR